MRSTHIELAAIAIGAALLAGCAGSGKSENIGDVVKVVRTARDDVLAGRYHRACSALTAHGRQLALNFNVDFDEEGTIRPGDPRLPKNCEEVVARVKAQAEQWDRDPMVADSWLKPARTATFELSRFDGSKAEVRIRAGSYKGLVKLVKTDAGWRIDDADFVPFGH